MSEDGQEGEGYTRREALKIGLAAAGLALGLSGSEPQNTQKHASEAPQPERTKERFLSDLVGEIDSLPLEELEWQVYHQYPVVPELSRSRNHLSDISTIEPGSNVMLAGSSVAIGMLESIDPSKVDVDQIDLGSNQHMLEPVLTYFDIHAGDALHGAVLYGGDIPQLLDQTIDAYVDIHHPAVSINFVGTNVIRFDEVTLDEFAEYADDLINKYISRGVIPILTTFPTPSSSESLEYSEWFNRPYTILQGNQTQEEATEEEIDFRSVFLPEHALKYNLLLLRLADAYDIPIINLERGLTESAELEGDVPEGGNVPERDPNHISVNPEPTPLIVPENGQKFQYGEAAVSYFVLQTLYQLVPEN